MGKPQRRRSRGVGKWALAKRAGGLQASGNAGLASPVRFSRLVSSGTAPARRACARGSEWAGRGPLAAGMLWPSSQHSPPQCCSLTALFAGTQHPAPTSSAYASEASASTISLRAMRARSSDAPPALKARSVASHCSMRAELMTNVRNWSSSSSMMQRGFSQPVAGGGGQQRRRRRRRQKVLQSCGLDCLQLRLGGRVPIAKDAGR